MKGFSGVSGWKLAVAVMIVALGCGSGDGGTKDASSQLDVPQVLDGISEGITGDVREDGQEDVQDRRLSRLSAQGRMIVDAEGNEVLWRGVNLGGWLFHETWITLVGHTTHGHIHLAAQDLGVAEEVDALMVELGTKYGTDPAVIWVCPADGPEWLEGFRQALPGRIGEELSAQLLAAVELHPFSCDDSDKPIRALLEERFGPDGRDELLGAFQDAWIQEKDMEWLAQQGFNVVRIPIGYRNLVTGPDSDRPTELVWNEAALLRLDRLLDWCEKHGVYGIVDIQEAPGGQNTYASDAGLYVDPLMQDLTVEMWEMLSSRYKERDIVAAYSLLAEPYGAPTLQARDEMYDRLVKAIRANDDDHLLIIHDGFKGMASLPDPATYGWENVVYSTHVFEWNAKDLSAYQFLTGLYDPGNVEAQETQNVPYYIGSFSVFQDVEWAYQAASLMVGWFEHRGWGWSLWTYKRPDDPISREVFGFTSSWGVRRDVTGEFQRPDPHLDSREELLEKLRAYKDLELGPNQRLLDALNTPTPFESTLFEGN